MILFNQIVISKKVKVNLCAITILVLFGRKVIDLKIVSFMIAISLVC